MVVGGGRDAVLMVGGCGLTARVWRVMLGGGRDTVLMVGGCGVKVG